MGGDYGLQDLMGDTGAKLFSDSPPSSWLQQLPSSASPRVRRLPHRALAPLCRRHFRVQHAILFRKRFKPGRARAFR
jgi:hypothetical protein